MTGCHFPISDRVLVLNDPPVGLFTTAVAFILLELEVNGAMPAGYKGDNLLLVYMPCFIIGRGHTTTIRCVIRHASKPRSLSQFIPSLRRFSCHKSSSIPSAYMFAASFVM
jgi:hypothetical protein